MTNADPMIELCTLMLERQLTSDLFAQWAVRHYGDPRLLRSADVEAIVEHFDRCLATPPVELGEDDFADAPEGELMERLDQLRAAMVLSIHGGVNRALVQWVSRHHGEPQSLDSARLRAIVLDFDTFLMQPGVEDTEFTQAMIRLRNVFARHAKMSAPATVSLGPRPSPVVTPPAPAPEAAPEPAPPEPEEEGMRVTAGPPAPQPLMTDEFAPRFAFDANSVMAEALSRAIDAPSWIDAIDLPAFASALPQQERRA